MPRLQLSFKNNNEELSLYNEVNKAYDKSAFIKECIKFYLDNKNKTTTKEDIVRNIRQSDITKAQASASLRFCPPESEKGDVSKNSL